MNEIKTKIFSKIDFGIKNSNKITKKDFFELKDLMNNLFNNYKIYPKKL